MPRSRSVCEFDLDSHTPVAWYSVLAEYVLLALQFDFRNGALRKKFDGLKYTLKRMETTLYEQSLTANLGFVRSAELDGAEGVAEKEVD